MKLTIEIKFDWREKEAIGSNHNLERDIEVKKIKGLLKGNCDICGKQITEGTKRRNFCGDECYAIYESVRPKVKLSERQREKVLKKARQVKDKNRVCFYCGDRFNTQELATIHSEQCQYKPK